MKNYLCKNLPKPLPLSLLFVSLIFLKGDFLKAEYLFEELEIDASTKTNENSSVIPTNPFELVEMIRRQNSMNDATNPSEAIDDALESFNMIETKGDL